jgi:hypothetical protein
VVRVRAGQVLEHLLGSPRPCFRRKISVPLFMAKRNTRVRKSINKGRGPGRPPKPDAANELLTLRLSKKTIEALDKWASREGVARSAAARTLIERGLEK